MEKPGPIDRHTDERDARLAFMVITDAGREKLSEACATFAKQATCLTNVGMRLLSTGFQPNCIVSYQVRQAISPEHTRSKIVRIETAKVAMSPSSLNG